VTVVLNLLTGAVVFVGEGKGTASLTPFWKRLRSARAKIEAVATDMSKAYIAAVRDNLSSRGRRLPDSSRKHVVFAALHHALRGI